MSIFFFHLEFKGGPTAHSPESRREELSSVSLQDAHELNTAPLQAFGGQWLRTAQSMV